jgi:hypothetical protein
VVEFAGRFLGIEGFEAEFEVEVEVGVEVGVGQRILVAGKILVV